MSGEQIGGIVRTVVVFGGGILAAKGYGDAALWQTIAASVAAIIMGVWSFKSKKA